VFPSHLNLHIQYVFLFFFHPNPATNLLILLPQAADFRTHSPNPKVSTPPINTCTTTHRRGKKQNQKSQSHTTTQYGRERTHNTNTAAQRNRGHNPHIQSHSRAHTNSHGHTHTVHTLEHTHAPFKETKVTFLFFFCCCRSRFFRLGFESFRAKIE